MDCEPILPDSEYMASIQNKTLSENVLRAFDALNGLHPGFRPAHAKGILVAGTFRPARDAQALTRAPHIFRDSTPATIRFSDFAGIPNVADNDPNASPRGIAIRFHLAEHVHTDIIGHSVDGFPVRTAEEFVEFLQAAGASGPDADKPTAIERFLAAHPAAMEFVMTPKPIPASFTTETYYAVNAYRFTNRDGGSRYGKYRIEPEGGAEYLDEAARAKASADFLFDQLRQRLARGPASMRISVQVASAEDITDDSTVHWPKDRPIIEFGTLELTTAIPNENERQRQIIFDPIPRVDGIDPSGDPLLEARADVYLMSGRRRRTAIPK
jgi:catalase